MLLGNGFIKLNFRARDIASGAVPHHAGADAVKRSTSIKGAIFHHLRAALFCARRYNSMAQVSQQFPLPTFFIARLPAMPADRRSFTHSTYRVLPITSPRRSALNRRRHR